VPATQILLFPDPRPLLEKLGREFFLRAPRCPGVYLMRDAADTVVYVGKSKDLRKRLGSYRVANPDRMPRRHLRMLRLVVRVDLEKYPDESTALARESELLLKLKPRFNRAGTWPSPPRFLIWRTSGDYLEIAVSDKPEAGWEVFGPLRSMAGHFRNALARLFWCATNPNRSPSGMPLGWIHGQFESLTRIRTHPAPFEFAARLRNLCSGQSESLVEWVRGKLPQHTYAFDQAAIAADLDLLQEVVKRAPTGLAAESKSYAVP
jgi:excinuclease UvrABC nuclease subunit